LLKNHILWIWYISSKIYFFPISLFRSQIPSLHRATQDFLVAFFLPWGSNHLYVQDFQGWPYLLVTLFLWLGHNPIALSPSSGGDQPLKTPFLESYPSKNLSRSISTGLFQHSKPVLGPSLYFSSNSFEIYEIYLLLLVISYDGWVQLESSSLIPSIK
jgi:hypothetical protein